MVNTTQNRMEIGESGLDHWEILNLTSRTFFLSIRQLPEIIGEPICLAYLLLRISDFFEDNAYMQPGEKIKWLNRWDQALNGGSFAEDWQTSLQPFIANDPEAMAAYYAEELFSQFKQLPIDLVNSILIHVRDTTRGMARWVLRGPQVNVEEDMDDYMFEVAGRVGYLVTEVFAKYSESIRKKIDFLMPLARETGLALQTVNILRGLRKDFERGWIYIPDSYCQQVGLVREEMFDPGNQDKAMQIVEMLADKSEKHLESAMELVKAIPASQHKMRLAILWPILFAARTVSISRDNLSVLSGEAKIQRNEIKKIMRDTTLFGWSNKFLDRYYTGLISQKV